MNEFEFLLGIVLLLLGFNLGYREGYSGLSLKDFKKIGKRLFSRITR